MLKLQNVLKELKADQINLIVDNQIIAGSDQPKVSKTRPLTGFHEGAD